MGSHACGERAQKDAEAVKAREKSAKELQQQQEREAKEAKVEEKKRAKAAEKAKKASMPGGPLGSVGKARVKTLFLAVAAFLAINAVAGLRRPAARQTDRQTETPRAFSQRSARAEAAPRGLAGLVMASMAVNYALKIRGGVQEAFNQCAAARTHASTRARAHSLSLSLSLALSRALSLARALSLSLI